MLARDSKSKPKAVILHLCKVRVHIDHNRVVSEIHAMFIVSLLVANSAGDILHSKQNDQDSIASDAGCESLRISRCIFALPELWARNATDTV